MGRRMVDGRVTTLGTAPRGEDGSQRCWIQVAVDGAARDAQPLHLDGNTCIFSLEPPQRLWFGVH